MVGHGWPPFKHNTGKQMNPDKEKEDTGIFDLIAPCMSEFTSLLHSALEEGLVAVKGVVDSKKYIGSYYEFPTLRYSYNGLPDISSTISGGPTDYRDCFGSLGALNGREPLIDWDALEKFNDLIAFVKKNPDLYKRFLPANFTPSDDSHKMKFELLMIRMMILDVIDRYIHTTKSFDYESSQARAIVKPFVSFVFNDQLYIDIVVPLLFVDFDTDGLEISSEGGVWVERLSEEYHLARHKLGPYNVSINPKVTSSATHALIFRGWVVGNSERIWDFDILSKPEAYPQDLIETFLGALRIVASIDTGYAQIFSRAHLWMSSSKETLPCVVGTTVRSFPSWFENFYWNNDKLPKLSKDAINTLSTTYKQLIDAKEKSIDLAVKRLNRCMVRDSEEDSVLDATIALEALLSDDGNQEMTHKLAMRVGALTKLSKDFKKSPQDAFKDIKKIYAYRSAIVHGSRSLDKKKVIQIDSDKQVTTHSLVIEYLRVILKILLENPAYRDPKKIDAELLLGEEGNIEVEKEVSPELTS